MDRLSKKCVLTSGIVHGTLVLLLIVGPAFLTSDSKPDTAAILTFTDVEAIASGSPVMGQGTPNGGSAIPTPPEPKPVVEPPKSAQPVVRNPEPRNDPKPVDPPPKPNTDSTDPADKPRKPVIDLTRVVRNPNRTSTPKPNTAADDKARAQAAEAKANARQLANAIDKIRTGSSSGVDVGPVGVSTGSGPSVAAYSDILRTIYFNSWREPSDATMEDAVVKVTVTIARDGSVVSARITKTSGDPAVDRSVQHLIDSVPFIKAFPEDWKERQREFKLSFSLKAKRSLG